MYTTFLISTSKIPYVIVMLLALLRFTAKDIHFMREKKLLPIATISPKCSLYLVKSLTQENQFLFLWFVLLMLIITRCCLFDGKKHRRREIWRRMLQYEEEGKKKKLCHGYRLLSVYMLCYWTVPYICGKPIWRGKQRIIIFRTLFLCFWLIEMNMASIMSIIMN